MMHDGAIQSITHARNEFLQEHQNKTGRKCDEPDFGERCLFSWMSDWLYCSDKNRLNRLSNYTSTLL